MKIMQPIARDIFPHDQMRPGVHFVVRQFLRRDRRTGESIFAHSPEMDDHERAGHERHEHAVQHVETQQRIGADRGAAQEHKTDVVAAA